MRRARADSQRNSGVFALDDLLNDLEGAFFVRALLVFASLLRGCVVVVWAIHRIPLAPSPFTTPPSLSRDHSLSCRACIFAAERAAADGGWDELGWQWRIPQTR